MLFSDYLIETSYMELYDDIFEGNIEVSEVEVIEDSPTGYEAKFYVDEHEVGVSIQMENGVYNILFSVDKSFGRINVGARVALIIIRAITKVVSDYLIANKSRVKAVRFEADTRRGRQGVYNILAKSIKAHGYLDFSFTYPEDQRKQYLYIKEGASKYYSIVNDGGNHDSGSDIVLRLLNDYNIFQFSFRKLDNVNAKIELDVDVEYPSMYMEEFIIKRISELFNATLIAWDGTNIHRIIYRSFREGENYSGFVDNIMKIYGYVVVGRDNITLYERKNENV